MDFPSVGLKTHTCLWNEWIVTPYFLSYSLSAPGGWSTQGNEDYAYFESGFATGTHTLTRQQRDVAVRPHPLSKRQRRIRRPTRDQKIQIFFNITGEGKKWPLNVQKAHCGVFLNIGTNVLSSSKHPSACVKKWLNRSSQSEEAPAHVGATDQSPEENTGQTAPVQFPRVVRDDPGGSKDSGGQEGLPVLQTRLCAQRKDVWWVRQDDNMKYSWSIALISHVEREEGRLHPEITEPLNFVHLALV